ncbi:MAG TPA: chorismate synthase [Candidatus Limnocylindrales bacterium]|nr:chorismate synthase [Candidatus Limnocylindrales bacterium]
MTLRFLTAGESHGPRLTVIVDGVPAGLRLQAGDLGLDLARRQGGYGRGGRMKIEQDQARIMSGVRGGRTLGSPITLDIANRDWENWQAVMRIEAEGLKRKPITRVRPGHADLAGMLKYGLDDARDVLERASARETAARVAAGGVAKRILAEFAISVHSYTRAIGGIEAQVPKTIRWEAVERSPVRTPDPKAGRAMVEAIDSAKAAGDTLGGVFTVIAEGLPPGLGSYRQWDARLDGLLAQAIVSIPACKAMAIGAGEDAARLKGSQVHDTPLFSEGRGFIHRTNRAGGIEGGISNGEPIVVHGLMKPIATLRRPLDSVDVRTRLPVRAHYERSDVCVVPAAGVIGEAMVALTLARVLLEKFGGDSMRELQRNLRAYQRSLPR